MSLAEVWGVVTTGIAGVMVKVEVDVAQGLPSVGVVGLAGASVTEARWRARSAIGNIGATWAIVSRARVVACHDGVSAIPIEASTLPTE